MTRNTDPVCGMKVAAYTPYRLEHGGWRYRFCSQHCLDKFQENPAAYLAPSPAPAAGPLSGDVIYTCPMHPEVVWRGYTA